MRFDKGKVLRRLLRWTGRIPNRTPLLYPIWLTTQLDTIEEDKLIPQLPDGMNGLVIAYASDIHYGPLLNQERADALVQKLNAMEADLILLGGDYGEDAKTSIAFFKNMHALQAPLGVFAAIGNHDLMGTNEEIDKLTTLIEKRGIHLLRNHAMTVDVSGATLCICSVDDVKQGRPDFSPILASAKEADFTLFMPHSPDAMPLAQQETNFVYDLALAGHTHGGQLVVFGRSLHSSSRYGDRFRTGWMTFEGKPLMVSNGVGTSLLPIRLGTRPQIHRITLRNASAD